MLAKLISQKLIDFVNTTSEQQRLHCNFIRSPIIRIQLSMQDVTLTITSIVNMLLIKSTTTVSSTCDNNVHSHHCYINQTKLIITFNINNTETRPSTKRMPLVLCPHFDDLRINQNNLKQFEAHASNVLAVGFGDYIQ